MEVEYSSFQKLKKKGTSSSEIWETFGHPEWLYEVRVGFDPSSIIHLTCGYWALVCVSMQVQSSGANTHTLCLASMVEENR